jgi:hypothetical protein
MEWQFWLGVIWLVFIGYCFGRAHDAWTRYNVAVDKLQKLSEKLANKE